MKPLSDLAYNPKHCMELLRSLCDKGETKIVGWIDVEDSPNRWVLISGYYDYAKKYPRTLQIYYSGTIIHRSNGEIYGFDAFKLIDKIRDLGYDVHPDEIRE